MSHFRTPRSVLRESAGSYVLGKWVAGTRLAFTTQASIQPIVMGQDMQALPEGRHSSDYVKIYTADQLQVAADGDGLQPDIVVFSNYGYEIVSSFPHQSNVINHYKYIAVKAVKYTSDENWINGTTKRALNVI